MSTAKKTPKSRPASKAAPKATSHDSLIVGSKVKQLVASLGMRSDGDLNQAVSKMVREMIMKAAARVKARGQSTIRPIDL